MADSACFDGDHACPNPMTTTPMNSTMHLPWYPFRRPRIGLASAAIAALVASVSYAQSGTQTGDSGARKDDEEKIVELTPFVVNSSRDVGYQAANTLAGSRLNRSLLETPAAVSVFTKEFLTDIGATNVMEAMSYALNGGRDSTDYHGTVTSDRTDGLIQMRGFAGGTLLRDYFPFERSQDMFNTERIDLARGPNSILFGIGSTGGVVSATTKQADPRRAFAQAQLRVGSWNDYRGTLDANVPVGKLLALRVNALYQDSESWREFAFVKAKGGAAALSFRPWTMTNLRVNAERVERRQIVAFPWGPGDQSSQWLDAGKPISANGTTAVVGTAASTTRYVIYDPTSTTGPLSWFGRRITTKPSNLTPASTAQGPAFYRFDIIPRSANLMGPGSFTDNDYTNVSAFLEQRLGPLNLELAYNRNDSHRTITSPISTADNTVRADANGVLPNGSPNPNAGRFYVEGNPSISPLDDLFENFRATASMDLNLERFHLGKHSLVALASRERKKSDFWFFFEVNTTPAGTAIYPANLANVNNRVYRRTYLDFTSESPDLRGMHDPARFPIANINGVTSGYAAVAQPLLTDVVNEAVMVADQFSLWKGRLNVTAGIRRDKQTVDRANRWDRDPVTLVWVKPMDTGWDRTTDQGNTYSIGTVFKVNSTVALFANASENFSPQVQSDVFNSPLGPRTGRGTDFGVKLSLLEGRISATATRYELKQDNYAGLAGPVFIALNGVINTIWNGLNDTSRLVSSSSADTVNDSGSGWELDVTGNPTKQWRVSLNLTSADRSRISSLPRYHSYVETNRTLWMGNAGVVLPSLSVQQDPSDPTVGGAVRTIDILLANQDVSNGQPPYQFFKNSVNLFTAYTLNRDTPVVGPLTMGFGVNWRSGWVAGYNTAAVKPIWGPANLIANAMLSRSFVLKHNRRLQLQLNVKNVFDEDDLLVIDSDQVGQYRYVFQTPRTVTLTTTFTF